MKEQKTKRIASGTFRLEDGRELEFSPVEGETYAWEAVSRVAVLTEKEEKKAKAHGFDLEKVLKVKDCLELGMKPMEIHKETGYSRNTIRNYKNILSLKDTKVHPKDGQSTEKAQSVLFSFLFISDLGIESTFSLILILTPLLILAIGGYLRKEYRRVQAENLAHHDEVSKLHFQLTVVVNLSFRREPIICNNKKEASYYRKVLGHYNNVGRTVEVIERHKNQSLNQHWNSKEMFVRHYLSANRQEATEGLENMKSYWRKLEEEGLLDYLYTPKRANWKASKEYIYKAIDFLIKNPRPVYLDQARSKHLMDLMPKENNESIINNQKIVFEYEEPE